MSLTIQELRDSLLDYNEQAQSIQARADAEKRDLTDDEVREIENLLARFEETEKDIERRQRIENHASKLTQTAGRQAESNDPQASVKAQENAKRNYYGDLPRDGASKGSWGWKHFGEFAVAVRAATRQGGSIDPRLVQNAPTTYSSEGVGADGGFLVPPEYRTEIMTKVLGEASLLGRTDQQTASGNTMVFPKDETTPWGTSGVQAYWEGEAQQYSQSKPALESGTIRLNKLSALVPVTEEMLEDAPSIDGYLRSKLPQVFDHKINTAIFSGNGVGKPLGIINAPCTVSIAKESSQAADTINSTNIIKMYSRMYAPCVSRAVWLINQDITPQLMTMTVAVKNVAGTENVGGAPIYIPAGGLSGSPFGTLLGRPVIPVEAASTLGDKGDIVFADLTQYLTAIKRTGIRTDVSMHLWFDYDTLAYRFVFRVAGQPWWNSTISPQNGSATRSCFVTLDERG